MKILLTAFLILSSISVFASGTCDHFAGIYECKKTFFAPSKILQIEVLKTNSPEMIIKTTESGIAKIYKLDGKLREKITATCNEENEIVITEITSDDFIHSSLNFNLKNNDLTVGFSVHYEDDVYETKCTKL